MIYYIEEKFGETFESISHYYMQMLIKKSEFSMEEFTIYSS